METKRDKSIENLPAFLFMLMLWRVLPAKTVALFAGRSGESLAMGAVVILSVLAYICYLVSYLHGKLPGGKTILVPIIGLLVLGLSVLFHYNEWNTLYLSYYVRYVFFSLLILLSVKDYKYLSELYCKYALVTFLLLGWQPIVSSNVFANWMDYGFTIALPCTIGLYVLAKNKRSLIFWALSIASFLMAIAFANRSTWLCIVLFICIYEFIIEKGTIKRFVFIAVTLIIVIIIACNIEDILSWFIAINRTTNNFNLHSFRKIQSLLSGSSMDIFTSGRQEITSSAVKVILDSFPFGSGVGYFETINGIYSHNIALDLLLYWGFFGILAGVLIIIIIFRTIMMEKDLTIKITKVILLCMWFPKLLFSSSFTYDLAFWASIVFAIKGISVPNYIEDGNQTIQQS